MSYQSEERYWTDYVRVATPIVGLLLLLGVFWYWANSLIGADSSAPPPTAVLTVIPDDTPTPTPTTEAIIEDTPEPDQPTETSEAETPPTRTPRSNDDEPTETPEEDQPTEEPDQPTEEPSGGGTFDEGQQVVVTSGDVNMRAEPSTDSEVVAQYNDGDTLVIMDGTPREAGGYVWWQVRDEDSGDEGWIVEDWLAAAE